jgi:hypothetical protein
MIGSVAVFKPPAPGPPAPAAAIDPAVLALLPAVLVVPLPAAPVPLPAVGAAPLPPDATVVEPPLVAEPVVPPTAAECPAAALVGGVVTADAPALGALAPAVFATDVVVPAGGCPTMFGLVGTPLPPPEELEHAAKTKAVVQHQRVLTLMSIPSDCHLSQHRNSDFAARNVRSGEQRKQYRRVVFEAAPMISAV